jgi:hypothetical protein
MICKYVAAAAPPSAGFPSRDGQAVANDVDMLIAAIEDLKNIEVEEVATSTDQRLKVTEIKALIAIAQALLAAAAD